MQIKLLRKWDTREQPGSFLNKITFLPTLGTGNFTPRAKYSTTKINKIMYTK